MVPPHVQYDFFRPAHMVPPHVCMVPHMYYMVPPYLIWNRYLLVPPYLILNRYRMVPPICTYGSPHIIDMIFFRPACMVCPYMYVWSLPHVRYDFFRPARMVCPYMYVWSLPHVRYDFFRPASKESTACTN